MFKLSSQQVIAKPRKLKCSWSTASVKALFPRRRRLVIGGLYKVVYKGHSGPLVEILKLSPLTVKLIKRPTITIVESKLLVEISPLEALASQY